MAAPRSYAAIRRAVAEIMRENQRGAMNSDAVREALGSLLSPRANIGRQFPLDYYTPARGDSPRMRDLLGNREVRRRVLQTIEEGMKDKRSTAFYDTRPIRAIWDEALGEQEAPQAFRTYMGLNAAMSPQTKVPEQIRRANHVYGVVRSGRDVPMYLPTGLGSQIWGNDKRGQYRLARNVLRQELNPMTAPKIGSYRQQLQGNLHDDIGTIDQHATALPSIFSADWRWLKNGSDPVTYNNQDFSPRAAFQSGEISIDDALEHPSWWGGRPRDNEYRSFVGIYRDAARELGLPNTAAAQAAGWRGGADITGVESPEGSITDLFINEVIKLAEKHGMSLRDAAIRVARGDPKFYSVAALSPVLLPMLRGRQQPASPASGV